MVVYTLILLGTSHTANMFRKPQRSFFTITLHSLQIDLAARRGKAERKKLKKQTTTRQFANKMYRKLEFLLALLFELEKRARAR